jgi:hypothetical protein
VLEHFEFDLNLRTVTLTFTETVNVTTLKPTMFILQGSETAASNWTEHAITDAYVITDNGPVISFKFSVFDANMIKIRTAICTEQADTFLRMSQGAVLDMVGNPTDGINENKALACTRYTEDSTAPKLVGFNAEMPTKKPPIMLTLTFDETVVLSELDVSGITIEDGSGTGYTLTHATATQDSTIPTVVVVTVSPDDLEGLRAMKTVGREKTEFFIDLGMNTIADHAGNMVVATPDGQPLQVTNHSVDITPPEIVEFGLDLDSNELRLTFSEHVEIDTVDLKTIRIQESDSCDNTLP